MNKRVLLLLLFYVTALWATKIELWTMSQCPHGGRGSISLAQVKDQLIDPLNDSNVEIDVHYILKYDVENKKIKSLGGNTEVYEDIIQLVIMNDFPEKYWDYVKIRNTHNFDTLWRKDAVLCGLDPDEIVELALKKGRDYAFKEIAKTDSAKIYSSPTLIIDGFKIDGWLGDYSTLYMIVKNIILEKDIPENLYKELKDLPQCIDETDCPVKSLEQYSICRENKCEYIDRPIVQMNILVPDTFYNEITSRMITATSEYFPRLYVNYVNHNTEEGRLIGNNLGVKKLPAYYFEDHIQESQNFEKLRETLETIRMGNELFYLIEEENVEYSYLIENDYTKEENILFCMAECPYSAIAIDSIISKGLTEKVKVHYILAIDDETGKLMSLHGEEELFETKNQLVLRDYYPNYYWQYLKSYNQNHDYLDALQEIGIDIESFNATLEEKGEILLKSEAELAETLSINASPTFLWNGHYIFLGAEGLEKILKISVSISGSCK